MTRINELAAYCNLKRVGTRGILWWRKSATSPTTRKQYFAKRSTATADLRTAVIKALPLVEDFLARIANPHGPVYAGAGDYATLAELFKVYREAPTVKANKATRERNIGDMRRVVLLAHGDGFEADQASSEIIAKPLAKLYQSKRLAAAAAEHGKDLAAMEASKRAINSTLKHAQSLFSREAMDDYGQVKLPASVREFADALPVPAKRAAEPEQLRDEFVQAMMSAMALHKAVDLAVWATFQLFVWGGLRNIECRHARRGWLEKIPAGYRLQLRPCGDFLPKGRNTSRVLPGPVVEELLAGIGPGDDEYLIPALSATDRHDAIYRRLNDWLKDQGVMEDAGKIAYRLRKYFFKKVEEQQGLMLALAAHGGGQLSTLTDHYTGAPKMATPIKLNAG